MVSEEGKADMKVFSKTRSLKKTLADYIWMPRATIALKVEKTTINLVQNEEWTKGRKAKHNSFASDFIWIKNMNDIWHDSNSKEIGIGNLHDSCSKVYKGRD